MSASLKSQSRIRRQLGPRRPLGRISSQEMYTTSGLRRAIGFGRETLIRMRQDGVKPIHDAGKEAIYDGAEVVEWIRKQKQKKGRAA